MEIKISIIVPVYNVEKYIDQCLESIVCQLNEKIEIILVNDGSTDNSNVICERYCREFHNIVLYNQDNRGVSEARNYGIKKARGDYLLFIDSDDWIVNNIFSEILNVLNNNEPDIVLGKKDIYLEKFSKYEKTKEDYAKLKDYSAPEEVFECLAKQNPFWLTVSCVVVNRRFLLENNLFFYNGIRHEDELWVPLLFFYASKIEILDKSIFCYRIGREGSFSKTKNISTQFDKLRILDEFSITIAKANVSAKKIKLLKDRSAVLEWGLIQDIRFYENDPLVVGLKCQIRKRLRVLQHDKYIGRFWLCRLFGIDNVRKINLLRIQLLQYLGKC